MERLGPRVRPHIALILILSAFFGLYPDHLLAEEPATVSLPENPIVGLESPIEEQVEIPEVPVVETARQEASGEPLPIASVTDPVEQTMPFSSLSAGTPPAVVTDFNFTYVPERYIGESGTTYKTALRTGDTNFGLVLVVDTEAGTPEVSFDLSELGIPSPAGSSIGGPFWGVTYYADLDLSAGPLKIGMVPDGLKTLRATVRDGDGAETTAELEIYVDSTLPTMEISAITRSEAVIGAESTLLLSGAIDGTGTDTQIYEIWQREYDADGVILRDFMSHWMPGNEAVYAIASGVFTDIPLVLQSQTGDGTLHPNAVAVSFSFLAVDEAGNEARVETDILPLAGEIAPPEPLVSNVLFLPGIKGSRLYGDVDGKLWIPGGDGDVRELFLDVFGKSERDDIHVRVGDVLSQVEIPLFPIRIYQSFTEQMDALQSAGTITDWEPVPYDWRLSLPDIINNGLEVDGKVYYTKATTTPYIEQTLRQLAASSKTGKVSVVAHSNGGMVAKALMQKLGDAETAALIDEVVFVGVPQAGAPQALGALLYGYDESLPNKYFPVVSSASASRSLAENAPMAYHLLPTKTYFDQASADERQIVQFKGAQAYAKETAAYGTSVDSWGEMSSFIQASENGRTKPAEKDLKKAGIGNANLLTYAEEFHNEVSSWTPPAGVDVHQIAGWGMETFIGVELREFSLPWFGTVQEDYLPVFARNGDEVVPSKSGSSMPTAANIRTYWIDLDQVGDRTSIDYSHENLLEIDSALELISDVLAQEEAIALPNNTYNAEPSLNEMDSRSVFRFYLHSPLTLEVIDSEGNRIGMNGDGTIDAEIEGGEYDTFGEVHYITVPTGKHYTVLLDGYDDGFFSLDVQEIVGDRVIQDATFAGLPSTPQTTAQLEILGTIDNSTALSVDIDGDGNEDAYLVAQINEDVVYTPDEVEEKENTDTDSRESSGSKSRNTTGTEVDEGSMPAQAGMIEIELPGIEKKILLTKENHGEVLGALDDASKVEGEDRIIHEPTPKNWATSLVSWVYTLIMSVFAKISSLLTFTYAN